jgi:hypothetical protein
MGRETPISLLHATYRAGASALRVRAEWLASAATPTRVEHVFALDEDDEISVRATEGLRRVVSPPQPTVTAVRNWNAAAHVATGHILFVIADDLTPPVGWDTVLDEIVGTLDPHRFAFAVRVADIDPGTDSRPTLLRHPVVSRRFYEAHGLFDPEYTSLFCDDDITLRSFHRAVVVDGSSLRLQHHRSAGRPTPSQSRINTDEELAHGRRVRDRKWKRSRLPSPRAFFRPPRVGAMVRPWAVIWRLQLRARSLADAPRRLTRRFTVAGQLRARRLRAWATRRTRDDQPTDRR